MIYVVLFFQIVILVFQIVILAYMWHVDYDLIPLKIENKMMYKYILGFLSRYCAEHQDYGEFVFPETWKKIEEEKNEAS